VRFSRRAIFRIETSPGPQSIAEAVAGSADPRSVSVAVSRARLSLR
jgi:hypothetical protein